MIGNLISFMKFVIDCLVGPYNVVGPLTVQTQISMLIEASSKHSEVGD